MAPTFATGGLKLLLGFLREPCPPACWSSGLTRFSLGSFGASASPGRVGCRPRAFFSLRPSRPAGVLEVLVLPRLDELERRGYQQGVGTLQHRERHARAAWRGVGARRRGSTVRACARACTYMCVCVRWGVGTPEGHCWVCARALLKRRRRRLSGGGV